MLFEELQPDLQQWLRSVVNQGYKTEAIVDSLRKAGYESSVSSAVQEDITALRDAREKVAVPSRNPSPWDSGVKTTSDREVQVLMTAQKPNLVLFGNLLSGEECDELIALSQPRLKRSKVVNSQSGQSGQHAMRTSSGAVFRFGEFPLVKRIEQRISELVDIPVSRGEGLQVLNYAPGAEYKPHHDYFDPQYPGSKKYLQRGGQRCATLIIYLNDVEAGGSTVFPSTGVNVYPRKGYGLFFSYADEQGGLDPLSLHGGSPVIAGEKWVATKWMRLRDYVDEKTGA
ncbi:2OG-Fe(II) oxygenase [Microbulbifer marinus]|uniref:Prolyl 4-hydroxylase n=1 Tax=Microbulbifer marinus TaxID=658218 RepID=A0A1H3WD12_9GAMM|nr:2OG-Fe(II) oxygenase [Microbulbifer marinus]SDZ85026.1 prolyl 4-hydroxylase [Microbulbifer marinus]